MKRTTMILAISAATVLMLAPAAMAQYPGGLSPSGGQTPSLPYQAQPLTPLQIQQGVGSVPQDATTSPAATASPAASPVATASPSATASSSASASPSASASALPDTGGAPLSPVLAVVAFLALLASGGLALRLTRSRNTAS